MISDVHQPPSREGQNRQYSRAFPLGDPGREYVLPVILTPAELLH